MRIEKRCWGLQGEISGIYGVDKDGNSNLSIGLAIAKKERIKKKNDSKTYAEYINYLGQEGEVIIKWV